MSAIYTDTVFGMIDKALGTSRLSDPDTAKAAGSDCLSEYTHGFVQGGDPPRPASPTPPGSGLTGTPFTISASPYCDGDRAIVVGWRHKGELCACFLALPAEGWFFRLHSALASLVIGAAMLFLPASVIAMVMTLPGFVLGSIAAMPIFMHSPGSRASG